jgi:hypothetical protein
MDRAPIDQVIVDDFREQCASLRARLEASVAAYDALLTDHRMLIKKLAETRVAYQLALEYLRAVTGDPLAERRDGK